MFRYRYIMRLDDACPTMKHENWDRIEKIFDKYNILPIVGIIPDCKDDDDDFKNVYDCDFWKKAKKWQEKGWEISQHGLNHKFYIVKKNVKYFQKNIGNYSEFAGLPKETQKMYLEKGYEILVKQEIRATSFFAPAHTYDENTVKACLEMDTYKFISDGYGIRPYKKNGMIFIPSIFDTPRKMPMGLYTFIYHPSKMTDADFEYLETFLNKNQSYSISINDVFKMYDCSKKQGLVGSMLEWMLFGLRSILYGKKHMRTE